MDDTKPFDDFIDHGIVQNQRSTVPADGNIVNLDASYFSSLPLRLRDSIHVTGYVARFYSFPARMFSSIIEKILMDNKQKGSIVKYSSSITRKEKLPNRLIYYATIISNDITINEDGNYTSGNDGIGIIAVFDHDKIPNASIILVAADDTDQMKYDAWMDKIREYFDYMMKNTGKKRE